MATLQTIRTKAGLLVAIVIGLSLAAFILGDMFQGGTSMFQGDRLKIGEINGETIQYPQFQQQVERLGDIYRMNTQQNQLDEQTWVQVREQTWQNIVREQVMTDVYDNWELMSVQLNFSICFREQICTPSFSSFSGTLIPDRLTQCSCAVPQKPRNRCCSGAASVLALS
jgi:hypothetical protein